MSVEIQNYTTFLGLPFKMLIHLISQTFAFFPEIPYKFHCIISTNILKGILTFKRWLLWPWEEYCSFLVFMRLASPWSWLQKIFLTEYFSSWYAWQINSPQHGKLCTSVIFLILQIQLSISSAHCKGPIQP